MSAESKIEIEKLRIYDPIHPGISVPTLSYLQRQRTRMKKKMPCPKCPKAKYLK